MGNKRSGNPDIVVKIAHALVFILWILMFVALGILAFAQPEFKSPIDNFIGGGGRYFWDRQLLRYSVITLFVSLIIVVIGILITSTRHKRKEDQYPLSFLLLGAASICGILFYFFKF